MAGAVAAAVLAGWLLNQGPSEEESGGAAPVDRQVAAAMIDLEKMGKATPAKRGTSKDGN